MNGKKLEFSNAEDKQMPTSPAENFKETQETSENLRHLHDEIRRVKDSFQKMEETDGSQSVARFREKEKLFFKGLGDRATGPQVLKILHTLASYWNSEAYYQNDFVQYALEKIEEYSSVLESALQKKGSAIITESEVVELYGELTNPRKASEEQRKRGAHHLANHFEWLNSQMIESKDWNRKNFIQNLVDIAQYGDENERRQAQEYLVFFAHTSAPLEERLAVAAKFFETNDNELRGQAYEICLNIFESYGLPAKEIWEAWVQSEVKEYSLIANFQRVDELEKDTPGICRFLYEEYGIANFARYPKEMLTKQFEEKDTVNKPYGVIIYPPLRL